MACEVQVNCGHRGGMCCSWMKKIEVNFLEVVLSGWFACY